MRFEVTMPARLPVTVLASIDAVLRDTATMGVVVDLPAAVALSYAVDGDALTRTISDRSGTLESERVPLDHMCLGCAMREDVIPTLLRLADLERWDSAVLALPVGAEPAAVSAAFDATSEDGVAVTERLRLASVVALADLTTFEGDVFGTDLLVERGIALSDDDRRAVGEALAHQVEYADVVVAANTDQDHHLSSELLDHLRSPESLRSDGLHQVEGPALLHDHHDAARSARRLDPRRTAPVRPDAAGVWALELSSPHPFHPARLMESIERLGAGRVRTRGRFWLPTRPGRLCAWDGAGGQLSIGDVGAWGDTTPDTRLVVVGTGDDQPRLRQAFDEILMSDAEVAAGLEAWVGQEDSFDPWLGDAGDTDDAIGAGHEGAGS